MIDAGRLIALLVALVMSVRRRFSPGVLCAVAALYIFAADVSGLIAQRPDHALDAMYAFVFIFFGPSGMPYRGHAVLPLGALIGAHQLLARTISMAIAAIPIVVAVRRSSRLRPETEEARRYGSMVYPFLTFTILDALTLMVWLLISMLATS